MNELERILTTTEQLLRIESETGGERMIADHLERELRALRPQVRVRVEQSLCVVPRAFESDKRTVMLLGHTDTVPKLSENPVRREGDRLHGLGASDMKAALAIMLALCERATRETPRLNFACVFYAAEEGPFAGSELPAIRVAARDQFERTDLAICLEPTDNQIELGCLGTLHAAVTFTGKRAHSARPWQGDNAIHKAAPLLARLAARAPIPHVFDGLEFKEVISATLAEVRGARNVVPDLFTLNLNYRFAPGKDEEECRAELDALIAGEASCEIRDFCPAGKVCLDNALLQELRVAAGAPQIRAKQAWTDVGRLSHWGIDSLNFGPGATAQAHQAGEWVSCAEIEKSWLSLCRFLFPTGR